MNNTISSGTSLDQLQLLLAKASVEGRKTSRERAVVKIKRVEGEREHIRNELDHIEDASLDVRIKLEEEIDTYHFFSIGSDVDELQEALSKNQLQLKKKSNELKEAKDDRSEIFEVLEGDEKRVGLSFDVSEDLQQQSRDIGLDTVGD